MSDEATEVPADDAVPCGTLTAVELEYCERDVISDTVNIAVPPS